MKSSGSAKALTILLFLLVIFGLIMLSSAGVVEGQKKFNSSTYFVKHQLIYGVIPGILIFFILSKINPKIWKKFSLLILFFVTGLMVLVFLPQFGIAAKGALRWVRIGPITFQPAEFLKLALIIYLAAWFSSRSSYAESHWSYSLLPFLLVLCFIGGLLAFQPDLKTLTIVILLGFSVYFFSGAKVTHMISLVLVFAILVSLMAYFAPYRWNRIRAFINPTVDTQGVAYHTNQALLSVGNGGLFGVGFGKSQQKINYLPEPMGDSIFAIVVEELGFVGGAAILGLFLCMILTLINIARKTGDQFGKLFVLGLSIWISLQTLINVGAILNLIPMTGVPLPFFSYGSSALTSLFAATGIAVAVAKHG